ncbi:hypothetical protein IEO21_03523 [Rhodonia placenta]|uniref:Uncharacterized protein n=1 Tax=Rhodonia placenta TaxID=104341 RepID=A0A8H7P5Z2_9APHY|nr:hypothetical protein IEO21_03523 [Postia placenta]
MNRYPGPVLPLELYEYTVSLLSCEDDDATTLYACCLLCRTLLPASRRALYRSIWICSRRRLTLLARVLRDPRTSGHLSWLRELHLYVHDSSEPASEHEGVGATSDSDSSGSDSEDDGAAAAGGEMWPTIPGLDATTFPDNVDAPVWSPLNRTFAHLLPSLLKAAIHNVSFIELRKELTSPSVFTTPFVSVTTVLLSQHTVKRFFHLQDVLSGLPALTEVHLNGVLCSERNLSWRQNHGDEDTITPTHLSILTMRNCDAHVADALLTWIVDSSRCQSLRHLSVCRTLWRTHRPQAATLHRFLENALNLDVLHLNLDDYANQRLVLAAPALRVLQLDYTRAFTANIDKLVALLDSTACASLRALHIAVDFSTPRAFNHWAAVAAALERPHFRRLAHLQITHVLPAGADAAAAQRLEQDMRRHLRRVPAHVALGIAADPCPRRTRSELDVWHRERVQLLDPDGREADVRARRFRDEENWPYVLACWRNSRGRQPTRPSRLSQVWTPDD